jgi:hypothetical protein
MHAAEAQAKCIVRLIGKAEHLPLFISVEDAMAARTERQVAAECVHHVVLRPRQSSNTIVSPKRMRQMAEAARTSQHKSFFIEMAERWLTLADDWELAPLGRRYALNVPI